MAQKSSGAKSGPKKGVRRKVARRKERRFTTSTAYIAPPIAALGMVGALVLGVGVFANWIQEPALSYAPYLVAVGGLGLGVALWFAQPDIDAICVGDAGIGLETGRGTERMLWCDMKSIQAAGQKLVASDGSQKLEFSIRANPKATASILAEAARRVPDVLDVPQDLMNDLPRLGRNDGLVQDVEDAQVAGGRCASSEKVIAFEEDARICPKCGQIYHKEHVPQECVTCEEKLGGKTLRA